MSAQPPPLPPGPPGHALARAKARSTPPPLPPALPTGPPSKPKKVFVPQPGKRLLDEKELARFKNLIVFAKTTVESRFAGRHKSPDLGSGGEFAEFKHYQPGHSTAALDWALYARSRQLYIRTYEEATDMAAHLVVDLSGSMSFLGAGEESKGLRAARVAAALAYLMLRQGDKASMTVFADRILHHVPVGGTQRHLLHMLNSLVKPAYQPEGPTRIAHCLRDAEQILKRRGRLVVLSDFLGEDPADVLDALGPFCHRRFEILLLQLSDPAERTLPNAPLARFVDAETGDELEVEPEEIRAAFEHTVRERTETLREGCQRRSIDFAQLDTRRPFLEAIEAYVGFRRWEELMP